jgi:hypothetical protein
MYPPVPLLVLIGKELRPTRVGVASGVTLGLSLRFGGADHTRSRLGGRNVVDLEAGY